MAHEDDNSTMINNDQNEYAISGKVLLIAVLILFALVVFILLLNLFARWRIVRAHRRELRRRQRLNRRAQLFFYVNESRVPGSAALVSANRGLQPEVLNSLPVFDYDSSKEGVEALECAVCLSEFEDDDKGRLLPKCGHCFHAECVDMWFHSHATCPLCRSKVELVKKPDINQPVLSRDELVNDNMGESSLVNDDKSENSGRKSCVSAKNSVVSSMARLENELEPSPIVPSHGHMYISPKSRRLSLRRLLSINRKTTPVDVTTSYEVGTSGNVPMGIDRDLETGFTLPESIA